MPFDCLFYCAATGAVGLPKRNNSFDANVTTFLGHRTRFMESHHKGDDKRQHGEHQKAVEVGKRGRLLLTQVPEFCFRGDK